MHAGERHAFLLGQDFFKAFAIFPPVLYDHLHYPLRPVDLALADGAADIHDHVVVLDHADLVVVKTKNLQVSLLSAKFSAYLCDNRIGLSN